jgi:hypothetical protein
MFKKSVVIAVLALALLIVGSFTNHYVLTASSVDLLWNANYIYLFSGVTQRGYRINYFLYPVEAIREYLGAVPSPNNQRFSVVVLRIDSDTVERYDVEDVHLGSIHVFENTIYASDLKNTRLIKWTGAQFVPASSDENQRLGAHINRFPTPNFSNVDGWSARRGPDGEYRIQLAGKTLTLLIRGGTGQDVASIDLARPGEAAKTIWSLDERRQKVGKDQYEQTFKGQ